MWKPMMMMQSSVMNQKWSPLLPGAPNGWSPPSPPDNWNPTINSLKREPLLMNWIIQDIGAHSLTAHYFNQREDKCVIPCLQVPLLFLLNKCESILCGYLYDGDLVFVILKGMSSFKFPKRFLKISS